MSGRIICEQSGASEGDKGREPDRDGRETVVERNGQEGN